MLRQTTPKRCNEWTKRLQNAFNAAQGANPQSPCQLHRRVKNRSAGFSTRSCVSEDGETRHESNPYTADLALDYAEAEILMTVTLTGATGFVGKHILRNLLSRGCSVTALVRDPSDLLGMPEGGALDIVQTPDLFAEATGRLEELLEGSETLVHAAWHAKPGEYLTSPLNVRCLTGTLNLAHAFAAVGGKRFVGVGTCAEYDPSAGLMTTDTPLAPRTLYAACKASAFQVLRYFLDAEGISFAWCRIFYLYGEGEDEQRLVPYIRTQLQAGQEVILSRGEQVRDFLDVEDAARMIADVALGQQQGAVNICSGEAVTIRQLAERIADQYGRRDLLRFGARPENMFDPPRVVGVREGVR